MKRGLSQCVLLLILVGIPNAGTLSLPEAQRILFNNNHDILIAEQEYLKSLLKVTEARSSWYPQVDAFINYGYQSEKARIAFTNEMIIEQKIGGMTLKDTVAMNIDRALGDNDRFEIGVNVVYPIFTGTSRLNMVRAQTIASTVECQNISRKKRSISAMLGMLFFQWEFASKSVEVQGVLIEQMTEYLGQMKDLHAGGVEPRSKVLQASARLENSKVDLLVAESRVDSLRAELLNLLNLSDSVFMAPKPYEFQPKPISAGLEKTYAGRPELGVIDSTLKRLQYTETALFGKRIPNLMLLAGYKYANPGIYMGLDELMSYGTIGLQLNWTLYDGMANWSKRAQLKHEMDIAERRRNQLLDLWDKRSAQARVHVQKAYRMKNAAEVALRAARAFAEDAKNSMDAGVLTSSEYLDALSNVAVQKLRLARAELWRKLAGLSLAYETGQEIEY